MLTFVLLYNVMGFSVWSSVAVALWVIYLVHFFLKLNQVIAFREYIMMMYGLNYLFAPAIAYEVTQSFSFFKMRLNPETYFSIAIPAMLCLHAGLYLLKTKIFTFSFYKEGAQNVLSENVLKQWLIAGFLISLGQKYLPGDLGFLAYLLGSIKYVAAFALFIIDRRKYIWYLYGLLFLEVVSALAQGMFHDMVIWILFFGMVWSYLKKPSAVLKAVLGTAAILVLFILQSVKGIYRDQLRAGTGGGFGSFSAAVSKGSAGDGGLFNRTNVSFAVTRANQAWIFASAMQTTDIRRDFQGMNLVKIYAESAFLPRALAPDKLVAGDTKIFNEFSGIRLLAGTSMALGLFADGYIAYGYYGTLLFAFLFGLICALVFKLVERWTTFSPYFVFFCFALLNYAVRPDCETQTWMGHIVKGAIVFGILIYFTRGRSTQRTWQPEGNTQADEDIEASAAVVPTPI